MRIEIAYRGDMRFEGGEGVARVVMDAAPESGGKGEALTPKHRVLEGLAGCSGMDVAHMLTRQGVAFEDLRIAVEAEQTKSHPKVFKTIQVAYSIRVAAADEPKVRRAIELSQDRFCGVSAMLGKTAAIGWTLTCTPLED